MTTVTTPARIILPIDFGEAIHVELTGQLPLDVQRLIEQVRADAYARGRHDELQAVAREHARLELLGVDWRQRAIADHRADVQARKDAAAARGEERRVADNLAAGRHPGYRYRGGPVDWDSGLPAGSACAWLWNKRRRDAEQLATVTELSPRTAPKTARQVAA